MLADKILEALFGRGVEVDENEPSHVSVAILGRPF